ncbi:MAG: hypothetical protein ACK5LR_06160 [Mangrovibacterium sp.]
MVLANDNSAFCQSVILDEQCDWEKYEQAYSPEEKLRRIDGIDDELLVYLKSNQLFESNICNFHFIDYNLDGNVDIIYSGCAGTDTERTLIFELQDKIFIKTMDKFGKIIAINTVLGNNLPPLSFTLKQKACCGGITIVYEVYHSVHMHESSELQLGFKYSLIEDTFLPSTFFEQPKYFEVKNDGYFLRSAPLIDNNSDSNEFYLNGNIVAQYPIDSKGYAIAQQESDDGRVWWFVVMTNNKGALESIFDTAGNNENNCIGYVMGWMSSRYLKII